MIAYILKHNLTALIYQKTVLFLIIIISFAASVFGILFYSGYFAHSYYDTLREEVCRIEIEIHPSTNIAMIHDILSSVKNLSEEAVISIVVSDGQINNHYEPGNNIPVIGKYDTLEKEQVLLGRYFSDDENNPVVLLSEWFAMLLEVKDMPIGMPIQQDKNELILVGILFHSENACIVPVDYYIENYPVTKISALFNKNVSQTEMQSISKAYDASISDYTYKKQPPPFLSPAFLPSFVQILLVYCFTLINIILVILLWQKYSSKRYMIYHICGMQDKHLIILIALQIIISSMIGILAGFLSYLAMLPFFVSLDIVSGSISDYMIVTGFVVIFIVMFSNIYSIKTVRSLKVYVSEE